MILGFARFKNRFEKNEKNMKKRSRKSDTTNYLKFNFFPHRCFDVFFMCFCSLFGHLFDDFSMFFASLFRDHLLMIFLFFPNRFLNRANPKIIEISLVLIGYSALGTFRKRSIFQRFSIPKSTYLLIICS